MSNRPDRVKIPKEEQLAFAQFKALVDLGFMTVTLLCSFPDKSFDLARAVREADDVLFQSEGSSMIPVVQDRLALAKKTMEENEYVRAWQEAKIKCIY